MNVPSESDVELVAAIVDALGHVDMSFIVRFSGLDRSVVDSCVERLGTIGAIGADGVPAGRIAHSLAPSIVGSINAAIAERLLECGLDEIDRVVVHVRRAVGTASTQRLTGLLDGCAAVAMSTGRFAAAERLLNIAEEADIEAASDVRVDRMEQLAMALEGQGFVHAAKDTRARAFEMAELSGHHDRLWRLAVDHALPSDWFEGDQRAAVMLAKAADLTAEPLHSAAIEAARSLVSMRVPALPDDGPQVAWVTRASLAQPMADGAVAMTEGSSGFERLLSLFAWRSTHRAPEHLARRLVVSAEALDVAQRIHRNDLVVEAGLFRSVDGLEAGDPAVSEQSVAVARWAAMASGNPRLMWQVTMAEVGMSLLRDDQEKAEELRDRGRQRAQECSHPGAFSAEVLFSFQTAMNEGDRDAIAAFIVPDDSPLLAHSLARAGQSYAQALSGLVRDARRSLERSLALLDDESSFLLVLHMLARAALVIGETPVIAAVRERLAPFRDRVAVDSHGWWVAGPVACDLAHLDVALGKTAQAVDHWVAAHRLAVVLDDRRTMSRLTALRPVIERETPGSIDALAARGSDHRRAIASLDERERAVLELMVEGLTNREIAARLAFSPSTIRVTTMAIYRRLGLPGRPAVIAAIRGIPEL